jgi:hypothetical protein
MPIAYRPADKRVPQMASQRYHNEKQAYTHLWTRSCPSGASACMNDKNSLVHLIPGPDSWWSELDRRYP